jgi:hypothetical protein
MGGREDRARARPQRDRRLVERRGCLGRAAARSGHRARTAAQRGGAALAPARAELTVADGIVSHASGPRAHYGELAKEAAATPPGDVVRKARADWKLLGTAPPRTDLGAKVDGSAVFGTDVRLPEMRFAVIRHCPMIGGSAGAVDSDAAHEAAGGRARRPARPVRRLDRCAGGCRPHWWHARQGAQALRVEWRAPPGGPPDTRAIEADLLQTARTTADRGGGFTFHRRGDVATAIAGAARQLVQTYRAPYLAHATMEPVNCTAQVRDGRVEVWVPTQVPGMARALAAKVAGVAESAVTVHVTYLGGGFGRRLEVDVVGQAVRIALETGGRPVQLIWSREEDMTHDFYRPAGAAVLQAGLDAAGHAGRAAHHECRRRDHAALDRARHSASGRARRHAGQDGERRAVRPAVRDREPAHRARRDPPCDADRLLALGRALAPRVLLGRLRRRAGRAGRHRSGRLPTRAAEDMPRHRAVLQLAAQRAGWPGHGAPRRCRPAWRAASRCTRASAASSRRSSSARWSTAGRACSGSSALPTSAP